MLWPLFKRLSSWLRLLLSSVMVAVSVIGKNSLANVTKNSIEGAFLTFFNALLSVRKSFWTQFLYSTRRSWNNFKLKKDLLLVSFLNFFNDFFRRPVMEELPKSKKILVIKFLLWNVLKIASWKFVLRPERVENCNGSLNHNKKK